MMIFLVGVVCGMMIMKYVMPKMVEMKDKMFK